MLKGHVKNIEAKVWQNGHETLKMNSYFHAPAGPVQCKTHQSRINAPDVKWLAGFIIFNMTHNTSQKNTPWFDQS